ncbi:HAD-IG family 5'-nucleotidase [Vulgatibacter sp.]|uniref:HAD-IG family 5'-nucleotidase n=1 Tax=Vulgatibacter sp. TaxID=1971226 RepID=UPI0035699208
MTETLFVPPARRIYCNRTLNLRSIRAIGYDMDYTLVHYSVEAWERRAYEHLKARLLQRGWPVADLEFDPALVARGLVIDTERGNLVKANRFGFVKKAAHGTRVLGWEEQREAYTRTIVDLAERRWAFLNTLFSLSEACMYAQLVDLVDRREAPEVVGYHALYQLVRETLDETHMEGRLKEEILADPERYVILDEEAALALLDQHHAGKRLLLITNSEWSYTQRLMSYSFDRFLPGSMTWRDLFEIVIVGARKPHFFTTRNPLFEVVEEERGYLLPAVGPMRNGVAYLGGSARQVEQHLGLTGDEILYVGDHMFGDVRVTKDVLRWRTALVLRELEEELESVEAFRQDEEKLATLMNEKERIESEVAHLQLQAQRLERAYGPQPAASAESLAERMSVLRGELQHLDERIAPLAQAGSELMHGRWGLLLRAGNDKSHLARQVERYADIYTSRVSNLLFATPFLYLRSPRGSLPHDPGGVNVPSPP